MKVKQHGLPRRDIYSAVYGNATSFFLTVPTILNKKRLLKRASKQTHLPPGKIALGTAVFPYNKRADESPFKFNRQWPGICDLRTCTAPHNKTIRRKLLSSSNTSLPFWLKGPMTNRTTALSGIQKKSCGNSQGLFSSGSQLHWCSSRREPVPKIAETLFGSPMVPTASTSMSQSTGYSSPVGTQCWEQPRLCPISYTTSLWETFWASLNSLEASQVVSQQRPRSGESLP